jgi:hypothetical protein
MQTLAHSSRPGRIRASSELAARRGRGGGCRAIFLPLFLIFYQAF